MQQEGGKNFFYAEGIVYELARGTIYTIIVLIIINFFVATINIVQGASMEDSFYTGDVIILNKISYLVGKPQRGDVVALRFPGDPEKQKYIKRVIGLPGEKIEIKDSKVYINGKELLESYLSKTKSKTLPNMVKQIAADEYFIMGDNRPNSNDSRAWGTARESDFIGKGFFNILPADPAKFNPNSQETRWSRWGFITPVFY